MTKLFGAQAGGGSSLRAGRGLLSRLAPRFGRVGPSGAGSASDAEAVFIEASLLFAEDDFATPGVVIALSRVSARFRPTSAYLLARDGASAFLSIAGVEIGATVAASAEAGYDLVFDAPLGAADLGALTSRSAAPPPPTA